MTSGETETAEHDGQALYSQVPMVTWVEGPKCLAGDKTGETALAGVAQGTEHQPAKPEGVTG